MYNIYIKNYNAGNGVIETEHLGVESWLIDNDTGFLILIYNQYKREFVALEQVLGIEVLEIRTGVINNV